MGQVERAATPVRGVELHWERAGAGAEVVWGHGLTHSRRIERSLGVVDWDQVAARVVRYDARGHGDSSDLPGSTDLSWDGLALDQIALADALGLGRFVTGGCSMGAGTALHAAVLAPERIRACILALPPTGWEARQAQGAVWRALADLVRQEGIGALVAARQGEPVPMPLRDDPHYPARRDGRLDQWTKERLARAFEASAEANLPPRREIASIEVPCLILAWEGDPVHPVEVARELAELLPQATLHVASTSQDLQGWTALVDRFIADLGSDGLAPLGGPS